MKNPRRVPCTSRLIWLFLLPFLDLFTIQSLSASSCWEYSLTVFQANSDSSAVRISFCLFVSIDIPSDRKAFALSTALALRCNLASSYTSWSFLFNLCRICFSLCLNTFGSSPLSFLISLSFSMAASTVEHLTLCY